MENFEFNFVTRIMQLMLFMVFSKKKTIEQFGTNWPRTNNKSRLSKTPNSQRKKKKRKLI